MISTALGLAQQQLTCLKQNEPVPLVVESKHLANAKPDMGENLCDIWNLNKTITSVKMLSLTSVANPMYVGMITYLTTTFTTWTLPQTFTMNTYLLDNYPRT